MFGRVILSEQLLIADRRQVPVILVGNKIDLRGGAVTNEALEEEIAPLMRDFKVSLHPRFRYCDTSDLGLSSGN
jgi:GTPase SAR1 family protein